MSSKRTPSQSLGLPAPRVLAWGLTALVPCVLAGCGRLRYTRVLVQRPPASAAVELLVPGLKLQQCFDLLGAPNLVQQLDNDDPETGYLCSWIWFEDAGYRVQVSAPIDNGPSASITYTSSQQRVPSLQLEFDAEDNLLRFERAYLQPEGLGAEIDRILIGDDD